MQIKKSVYFGLKDPLITLNGNKGQRWVFLTIPIPKEKVQGAFQIIIEARRGTSYLSDIDLAYVELTSNDTNKCHRLIMATKNEIDISTKSVQLIHFHDFISCRDLFRTWLQVTQHCSKKIFNVGSISLVVCGVMVLRVLKFSSWGYKIKV